MADIASLVATPKRKKTYKKCEDCNLKGPSFNYPGVTPPIVCAECSKNYEGMINVRNRKCEKCDINLPVWGYTMGNPRFCNDHKDDDMIVCIPQSICITDGCENRRFFAKPGEKAAYCKVCADKIGGMVNVTNRRCACPMNKLASYGLPGGKLTHCTSCKTEEMTLASYHLCQMCGKQATFYNKDEPGKRYCAAHHDRLNMSDHSKLSRMCQDCGLIQASFGLEYKKPTHCRKCCSDDMSNVVTKRCEDPDCTLCPSYGEPGGKKTHCKTHGLLLGLVPVGSILCDECEISARFGVPGTQQNKCFTHKDDQTMILLPMMRCCTKGCNATGTHYSAESQKIRYCDICAPDDAINFALKPCLLCQLDCVPNKDGLCVYCCDDTIKYVTKTKELEVKSVLDSANLKYDSHDKRLDGGECVNTRPDFFFDAGSHAVIVECDEDQHRRYAKECEITRMINLSQAVGMPTFWIRYNPDSYKNAAGKAGHALRNKRHEVLVANVKAALSRSPVEDGNFAQAVYLFYDGFDCGGDSAVSPILPLHHDV